jgi:hypothetical protein
LTRVSFRLRFPLLPFLLKSPSLPSLAGGHQGNPPTKFSHIFAENSSKYLQFLEYEN